MRGWIVCLFLFLSGVNYAQNAVNQVDSQGRKQGFWTKKDADGKLLYQATFKNDKPVGEMKRFHSNGKIMALMVFAEGSDTAHAQLFDESGNLIGKGKYLGQKKTGEWNYYLNDKVVSMENYRDGLKNGPAKRFYTTGELLEESNWKNNKLDGLYRIYYQDGKIYLECNYSDGQRNGSFKTWLSKGTPELEASYFLDARDKDWKYFDESGNLRFTLKFEQGKLLNPEVQDSIDKVKFESYKTKEDHLPDPEKFVKNPEEYMRQMQNH